jgi:hypothetical protein
MGNPSSPNSRYYVNGVWSFFLLTSTKNLRRIWVFPSVFIVVRGVPNFICCADTWGSQNSYPSYRFLQMFNQLIAEIWESSHSRSFNGQRNCRQPTRNAPMVQDTRKAISYFCLNILTICVISSLS